jgi:hypothetical protein
MLWWTALSIAAFSISHETPLDRIAHAVSVSSPVTSQTQLRQGQILVLKFDRPNGFASIHGNNFSTYIHTSDSLFSGGSAPLISLGDLPADIEVVALEDTTVTTTAFFANPTCTQIEWISSGSRSIEHLSKSDRLCYVAASLTGSLSISGTLGLAQLAVSGVSGSESITNVPSSGLKFELVSAQLIEISTDIETHLKLTLNFESSANISLSVPDRPGFFNGTWSGFVTLNSAPVYPPLSPSKLVDAGYQAGIILGGSMLAGVVIVAIVVRVWIGDDFYWRSKHRGGADASRPPFAPNPDEIPQEEDPESPPQEGVEDAIGTVAENPYEAGSDAAELAAAVL